MPIPVSLTSNRIHSLVRNTSCVTLRLIVPCSVNLAALLSRLNNAWRTFVLFTAGLIAALGWCHLAGLIAAATATAVVVILAGKLFIAVPVISFGAWWLGYLTLLARPVPNGGTQTLEWYPIGRLVLWAAVIGALIVAAAYVLLAALSASSAGARIGWPWMLLFFAVFTLGELYILPTGLGLFARLAPPRLGATTVASWFLAIFSGSLLAGLVGTLWSHVGHPAFFLLLSALAVLAALALRWLDPRVQRRLQHPSG